MNAISIVRESCTTSGVRKTTSVSRTGVAAPSSTWARKARTTKSRWPVPGSTASPLIRCSSSIGHSLGVSAARHTGPATAAVASVCFARPGTAIPTEFQAGQLMVRARRANGSCVAAKASRKQFAAA